MDTSDPGYWDKYYARRQTPWDFGGAPAALREFLRREKPGRVLIPGCGSGHEVRAFAMAGWDVLAIDFSPEAVRTAQEMLGEDGRLVEQRDFFAIDRDGYFDLVYERAFLCALPVAFRPDYAAQVARLLRPGGRIAGFFFFGPNDDPPPNPLAPDELPALLGPHFSRVEDSPVADSLPVFAGRERWQVWCKA
jgi:SAM-dependent methyltransferase